MHMFNVMTEGLITLDIFSYDNYYCDQLIIVPIPTPLCVQYEPVLLRWQLFPNYWQNIPFEVGSIGQLQVIASVLVDSHLPTQHKSLLLQCH